MKDITTKGLGSTPNVNGVDKAGKTVKTAGPKKIGTVQMTGVYAAADVDVPRKTSFVTIPDNIAANYSQIGKPSDYKPYNADQTTAYYEGLKQEGINDTDRASDKYLELT